MKKAAALILFLIFSSGVATSRTCSQICGDECTLQHPNNFQNWVDCHKICTDMFCSDSGPYIPLPF
ncbi:MAG: hypothetical protein QNK37_03020 [Acidobacteriota bacterium]|nr:hypothetical protein [Acidobacteriota bacterium]